MKKLSFIILISSVVISAIILNSCFNLGQISRTLTNLQKIQFKLKNINNFKLNGINISQKRQISDFSISDGLKLVQLFNDKRFPVEFTLNIEAKNPNDGTQGSNKTMVTLTRLEWMLYLDDNPTVSGVVNKSIEIAGVGYSTIIPVDIRLDLYEFYKNKSYEDVLNLALALGGVNGSTSKVKLDIKPTISTPFGPIDYPGKITVIDKEFRGN